MDSNTSLQQKYPEKSYYKNSEVCSMTGVKPYVLRFWENEFPQLDPVTSSSGHKLYEWGHIQIVKKIKELLFDQKMTVDTAKAFLQEYLDQDAAATVQEVVVNLSAETEACEAEKMQVQVQEDRWRECAAQINGELNELLGLVDRYKVRRQPFNLTK